MVKPIINLILILAIIATCSYGAVSMVKYFEARDYVVEEIAEIEDVEDFVKGRCIDKIQKINDKYSIVNIAKADPNGEVKYLNTLYVVDNVSKKALDKIYTFENGNIRYLGTYMESNMYFYTNDLEGKPSEIIVLSCPNLEEIEKIDLKDKEKINSNICMNNDGSKLLYTTDKGMYISDNNFKNTKLLLKAKTTNNYIPLKFMENGDIIYKKTGYDFSCGVGIIDSNGKEICFTEGEIDLLDNADTDLYICDEHVIYPIQKYNMEHKEITNLLTEDLDMVIISADIDFNKNLLCYLEEKNVDDKYIFIAHIVDLITNEEIKNMEVESDDISNMPTKMYFVNNGKSVLIARNNKINIWNY